jgi:hypothetical protein
MTLHDIEILRQEAQRCAAFGFSLKVDKSQLLELLDIAHSHLKADLDGTLEELQELEEENTNLRCDMAQIKSLAGDWT